MARPTDTPPEPLLLAPVRTALSIAKARLDAAQHLHDRAELLLAIGHHTKARDLTGELLFGSLDERLLAAKIFLATHEWTPLLEVARELRQKAWGDDRVRRLGYRLLILQDDLQGLERLLHGQPQSQHTAVDHLATVQFQRTLMKYQEARRTCEMLLAQELSAEDRSRGLHALGMTLYHLRSYDAAQEHLLQALDLAPLEAGLLVDLALTLIRLGRTDEAIHAANMALRLAPWNEGAHYLLGNGYTRRDYRQLEQEHPEAFARGADYRTLEEAEDHRTAGRPDEARRLLLRLARQQDALADVRVHLGALSFAAGSHRAARHFFRAALVRCPGYGRAHNGLAKALEAERLALEIHRGADEARFAQTSAPTLPHLDHFLLNGDALSPRHAKRVALSIVPWRRFLPVLISSGATYYIKPLHEKLSDTPEQELLRHRRISYDSRLWDDVRGCGGYRTVTGIEDVERTIRGGYDTVLHELTHQVHALLPAARCRQLEELYRRTLARQAAGEDAFISRYAATNAHEYFAEAAHALARPRRDRYDRREIVAERLRERDPEMVALVQELQTGVDVEDAWAVGQVNRGHHQLRHGCLEEALEAYRQAVERSPEEESTRGALLAALLLSGNHGEARTEAQRAARENPESATYALRLAEAQWLAGDGLPQAIAHLETSRAHVRRDEHHLLDQQLSAWYWIAGNAAAARSAAERVLAEHVDAPHGLWARAQADALGGAWTAAWASYKAAVRQRTGVTALRLDFACDLLRAGDIVNAAEQVNAARLLEPEEPRLLAVLAWLRQAEGHLDRARSNARQALELGPWCDLARLRLALVEQALGRSEAAAEILAPWRRRVEEERPPEYVFRRALGRHDLVHTSPAVERSLVAKLVNSNREIVGPPTHRGSA